MRIALDWRPAGSSKGGIGVYVRELSAALRRRFPADPLLLYGHGLRAATGLLGTPRPAGSRLLAAPIPTRLAEMLSRFGVGPDRLVGGCDVFHLTDYAWLGKTGAPLVATVHDVLFEELPACYTPAMRRGLGHMTRLFVRHAARIVVPSVRTKIGLVERFGADPSRVDVVPLAPRALPDAVPAAFERPYVLAVGTLEPRKNLRRLLGAHAIAVGRGADLDLVVAGASGWLDDGVRASIAAAPRVRWEGETSDERLSALYRGATAAAYVSLGEGFGLPVVEAMALGVPCLSSAGTACADVAGDGALLVDPYDVEAMADGLVRLATDEILRKGLRDRGLARAAGLSWDATAEGTRAAYERAAG